MEKCPVIGFRTVKMNDEVMHELISEIIFYANEKWHEGNIFSNKLI